MRAVCAYNPYVRECRKRTFSKDSLLGSPVYWLSSVWWACIGAVPCCGCWCFRGLPKFSALFFRFLGSKFPFYLFVWCCQLNYYRNCLFWGSQVAFMDARAFMQRLAACKGAFGEGKKVGKWGFKQGCCRQRSTHICPKVRAMKSAFAASQEGWVRVRSSMVANLWDCRCWQGFSQWL